MRKHPYYIIFALEKQQPKSVFPQHSAAICHALLSPTVIANLSEKSPLNVIKRRVKVGTNVLDQQP